MSIKKPPPLKNPVKAARDLLAARAILQDSVELYHSGRRHQYRVIATELTKLLSDGKRPLLERVAPGIVLHSIKLPPSFIVDTEGSFFMPMTATFKDGKAKVSDLFVGPPIPRVEWLDQPLFTKRLTVKRLLSSVRNKEGSHSCEP